MSNCLTTKRSPRSQDECGPFLFNWRAFSTRQVRLPGRRRRHRRNAANALSLRAILIFWACHSRDTMKKDVATLVTTQDFQKQVEGYGLTTANILYRRPEHPWLLQSYVWQNYDLYPDFPELQRFWSFGKNLSNGACIRSRSRIPASSDPRRSKQWMAFSGFIDLD